MVFLIPKCSVMLDNTIYMGVNAPKAHQRVIGKFVMQLGILYYLKKTIAYEPLPETMIDENKTSPTPDILLFDNKNKRNMLIIEVTGNTGMKRDFEKIKQLVTEYDVPEGFVYNYDSKKWLKFSLENGEDQETPFHSDLLQLNLNQLL